MFRTRESRVSRRRAFTLVELLVVIGIIAVLIGILLPTLSSARRVAQAAKCAAALREVGNAFQLYAMDHKGYYPPMRLRDDQATTPQTKYVISFNSVPPIDFVPSGSQQLYWMYFLAKYVSKGKMAPYSGVNAQDLGIAMSTVLWGCPNFQPITVAATDNRGPGVAMVYTGYGMNGFPEYTRTYPKPDLSGFGALGDGLTPALDQDAASIIGFQSGKSPAIGWANYNAGRWYKQKDYTMPAERALAADCRAYVLEALAAPNSASIARQADLNSPGSVFWGGPSQGETSYDYYRHGKYPKHIGNLFDTKGGKILFNILYADGHVTGVVTREEGIKAARMRFPG